MSLRPIMLNGDADDPSTYINGRWYCEGSQYLWLKPLYNDADTPDTITLYSGNEVSSIIVNPDGQHPTGSPQTLSPTPITDVDGNIIGYQPVKFTVRVNEWVCLYLASAILNERPDGWLNPMLILDPKYFELETPDGPPEVDPPVGPDAVESQPINSDLLLHPLKELFLPELRVDDGWNRYIDFLLAEVDPKFLRYGATQGVPFDFYVDSWKKKIADGASPDQFPLVFGTDTVSYPNPACPARFDFGTVDVFFAPYVYKAEIDLGDGEMKTMLFAENEELAGTYKPAISSISGLGSFKLYIDPSAQEIVENSALLRLAALPEDINPSAIQLSRKYNFALLDRNNPPITPAKLYGQLRALGDFNFYVAFKTADGYGARSVNYEQYVHILEKETLRDKYLKDYWNIVTESNVPIDALRDGMGAGSNPSEILGYDKRFLVARTNLIETELDLLVCANTPKPPVNPKLTVDPASLRLNQRGASENLNVGITPYGAFTPFFDDTEQQTYEDMLLGWRDNEGNITLLISPVNYFVYESTGITKNYAMTSFPAGPIQSIDVFIEALESQLVGIYGKERFDKMIQAMEAVLRAATPAWAGVSINFVYPQVQSDIELRDEWVGNEHQILVNGKSPSVPDGVPVTLNQRGEGTTIEVMTRPDNFPFDVRQE